MKQSTEVTAEVTSDETTGPSGEQLCAETLHVEVAGEEAHVPWTDVTSSATDCRGEVPAEPFDVDRIILYDGHIHAEADAGDGTVVELVPEYDARARFKSYAAWELRAFDADEPSDGTVVYERDDA